MDHYRLVYKKCLCTSLFLLFWVTLPASLLAQSEADNTHIWLIGEHPITSIPGNFDRFEEVYISPDGEHTAFHGIITQGLKTYHVLTIDGKNDWLFDAIRDIEFTDDFTSVTFIGRANDQDIFIQRRAEWEWKNQLSRHIDGLTPPDDPEFWRNSEFPFAHTTITLKEMSPHTTSYAYVANDGGNTERSFDDRGGKWTVRYNLSDTDGAFRPTKGRPIRLVISENGNQIAYVTMRGKRNYLFHGEALLPVNTTDISWVSINPDGEYVLYRVKKDNGYTVVFDGQESPLYPYITDVHLDPIGAKVAYAVGQTDTATAVVLGATKSPEFDAVEDITFSPNGWHLAYRAQENGLWHIVLDGTKIAAFETVDDLTFSPDSQQLAWRALEGGVCTLYCNNRKVYSGGRIKKDSIAFGPNNQVACVVSLRGNNVITSCPAAKDDPNGKEYVAIGSWQGRWYDEIITLPRFDTSGTKIAYGVRLGRDLFWVCDELPQHDESTEIVADENTLGGMVLDTISLEELEHPPVNSEE